MARPRKPTSLKVVAGTQRADRANGAEPDAMLLNDLEPPQHLDAAAAEVWRELAPRLRQSQVLTVLDTVALEMLCNSVADMRQVRAKRGDSFVTTSPKSGSEMLDQMLVAENMLRKAVESLGSRFGMDPRSRASLMVNPQGDLFGDQPAGPERFLTRAK